MKYIKNPNTKCTCSNPKHHATWVLNVKGIARSIEAVLKSGDSEKLTKDAYGFVYNMSGFIAHYDINGFRSTYSNTADLLRDLARSSDTTDADRYVRDGYFAKGEQGAYYAQKTELLKIIKGLCEKYEGVAKSHETDEVNDKFLALLDHMKCAESNPSFRKPLLAKLNLI